MLARGNNICNGTAGSSAKLTHRTSISVVCFIDFFFIPFLAFLCFTLQHTYPTIFCTTMSVVIWSYQSTPEKIEDTDDTIDTLANCRFNRTTDEQRIASSDRCNLPIIFGLTSKEKAKRNEMTRTSRRRHREGWNHEQDAKRWKTENSGTSLWAQRAAVRKNTGHLKIFKIIEKITQSICTSMMRRPVDGSVTFGYLFSTLPNIPDVSSGNDFPQNPTSTAL